ncbi:thiamine pyrophosphate-binding protein [Nocardia bovistercoris]|uniref:acetolactate synthase n=1 Tax=Nocardia bovistercoris TaxID=2785916 RepID=A0A931IDT0_9NOCA|nr:thiamine pyrophosphate-binding protein [Nocardia bovistercoris]MBH0778666.1 thiamine pyrophosphate-binding protein [Nocardia bovistercoris]
MPSRVVDHLVRAVAATGVRHIFGVDGANIEDLYDAIFDSTDGVEGVIAKHEFSAATMADGYARSTGGLGVVAATSGGGAMNLVAGLAESYASRVPVLALVGQSPTGLDGRGAFQDSSGKAGTIDAARLFETISRYCARVEDPDRLPEILHEAITAALQGGPAVLLLPKDIQQATIEYTPPRAPQRIGAHDDEGYARVRDALIAAKRTGKVVLIAGDQIARDDARSEFAALAATLDATVGVAPDAKDTYDNRGPGFRGVAGSMGHPDLTAAIRSAELCLLVGTPLPVTSRAGLDGPLADCRVASTGAVTPYLPAIHAESTDLARTLTDLTADLTAEFSARTEIADPTTEPLTALEVPRAHGPGLRYREVVETIDAALPDGTDVFADAGNTGAAVVHHLRVPRGGRFVVALGMGGMGYAFGAGIGSAFARHRHGDGIRRTVVIAGDGSFYMHGMEVHTAVEYDLPITFVVFNNNAHAMCVTREQIYYRNRYSFNRFRDTSIGEGIAAMFPSMPAHAVRRPEELAGALDRCFTASGPSFLSIDCDPDEIPPFVPFLSETPRRIP